MDFSSVKADLELMRREIDGAFRLHRSVRERVILMEKMQRARPKPVAPRPNQSKRKGR